MSKWKAGQIVTIEGKARKVKKIGDWKGTCIFCDFKHKEGNEYPCVDCMDRVPELIPSDCYFKEIKPKS